MPAADNLIETLVNAWLDVDTAALKAISVRESLEKQICDLVDSRRVGDRVVVDGREIVIERRTLVLQGARPERRAPAVVMYGTLNGKEIYVPPPRAAP